MAKRPTETSFGWLRAGRQSLLTIVVASSASAADVSRLELSIAGIAELEGDLVMAIFDSAPTFDERARPVAETRIVVDSTSAQWIVELAAPSQYAIIVYQDVNRNGQIDMTRLGIPREPFGFSNNARAAFGPPSFRKARFSLEPGPAIHKIELR